MEKTNKKMVLTINVDTGNIDNVTELAANGEVIDENVPAQRWPEKKGVQVGKLIRHIPCAILVYDDSPEDCIIFHQGDCTFWRIGC